ncbi:hypothetical protein [Uliginosibacterium sediminicola]|uniref:Uncharacterized protein n=1 Tax=Uliginosibacterium sediminicola TaxID=2024550 RepID=A0ABU9YVR1_9RHOO
MTIWGTHVFAKPLGRCVDLLRAQQTPASMPALNNLIRTLDEYLQATDIAARDVFRKAIGRPTDGGIALTHPEADQRPALLSDADIKAIYLASCAAEMPAEQQQALLSFARAIEAQSRIQSSSGA